MSHSPLAVDAWLLDCGIEAALFSAAMHLFCGALLAGASARDRHFILVVGFVVCLALPFVSGGSVSSASLQSVMPPGGVLLLQVLPAVWLAGVLLLIARHALNILRVEIETLRLARALPTWRPEYYRRLAQGNGIRRPPRLLIDPDSASASIQGAWRPIIKVGGDFVEQQQQIVLHELQHFKRRDLHTTIPARLVVAVYWPIPLAWWLANRLALDNERACDDAVLAAGYKPRDYAETLISAFKRQPLSDSSGLFALAVRPCSRQAMTRRKTRPQAR